MYVGRHTAETTYNTSFSCTTVAYDSIMGKNGAKRAKMWGGWGEIKIIVQF